MNNDGRLKFDIEQLTADSSVTTLNLAIPGNRQVLTGVDPGGDDVILPKGQKADYVQAKCSSGQFPWDTEFTLGTRDTDGTPTSPDTFTSDSGSEACTGVTGKGRVANIKVKLKNKRIRAGKKAKVGVTVRNGGNATLKKVRREDEVEQQVRQGAEEGHLQEHQARRPATRSRRRSS